MDTKEFLWALFDEAVGPESQISIWSLPSKQTSFFQDIDEAGDHALSLAKDQDVYFGCGLYRSGIEGGRGKAEDVTRITSVWADIDYGEGHQKDRIPKTWADAQSILARLGVQPSVIVDSGGGIHTYWILDEPLAPLEGAKLLRGYGNYIMSCAHALNFAVDSVFDLARVLRVPGTINHKIKGQPRRCEVRSGSGATIQFEDLDQFVMDSVYENSRTQCAPISVSQITKIDGARFEAMMQNSTKFKQTWNKTRTDLKDTSPSGYDLSLAHFAIQAGWSNDDIASLLYAFRDKHNTNPKKALRQDYLTNTIGRARANNQAVVAINELEDMPAIDEEATEKELDANRQTILQMLQEVLGVDIAAWEKQGLNKAEYFMILNDGTRIPMGDVSNVISQPKFTARVYEITHKTIRKVKADRWGVILDKLGEIVESRYDDTTEEMVMVEEWFETYLSVGVFSGSDWSSALPANRPFRKNGKTYVHVGDLTRHIQGRLGDRTATTKTVRSTLKAAGFTRESVSAEVNRKVVTRSYYIG